MAKKSKSINDKLLVYFPPGEENYEPVGPNARRLSMWLGYCVRSVTEAPLYGWKSTILPQYNTQLWNMVTDYFDVSPESPPKLKKLEELHNTPSSETFEVKQFKFRTHCFHVMKESYRKWKSRLRTDYYKKFDTDEERMQNIPEGLTTENWEKMLQVFASKEFVELSDRNSKNRANQTLVACTGPVTFAQVNYDMIDEETGEEPLASEAWMAQHATMNDNNEPQWVNNESFLAYQQIRRVEEEVVPVNPNVNVLKEAFKTRSGRIPGTGTGCKSKRQASINTQAGKVVQLEAQLAAVTTRLEEQAQRNQELTTRLEDQGRHNLLLNQRFEKLMEMVESQQHMPSSSEDTQSEETQSREERVEEEFEREQRYLKVMNLNRKRISPTKKSSAPKKK
ncbi:unnamed protein product [Linum tenue]|uniref:Transposase n=1 Tax=Linum tenue TaxID=586396 RepID=A0AAV0RUX6_9ROSI|nr:unnamed protein product [Linum tenue]